MALDWLKYFRKEEEAREKEEFKNPPISFASPLNDDGATVYDVTQQEAELGAMSGRRMYTNDFQEKIQNTRQLITQYRALSAIHEVDDAIQEIVDEAIVPEDDSDIVSLNLDNTTFSDKIKTRIAEELENVLSLYKFNTKASGMFRHWYIDSRAHYHKILDQQTNEIVELRPLDSMDMELVREDIKEVVDGIEVVKGSREYYIYHGRDVSGDTMRFNIHGGEREIIIPKEAIVYAHSGRTDRCSRNQNIIGYLHRAIKPANQLKMLEDALVIYRLTRAPERRVFYIDVSNMQARKAQQYVNNIMQGLKNRVVYDTTTGQVKNTNSNMAMLEDYYLPRRDGGKGTEVTTLPPGQNLSDIDDVLYFNRKLYKAMFIPTSRAQGEDMQGGISFGQDETITRDELKFTKFVRRLQNQFQVLLTDPLRHQLIVKKIITAEEWEENAEKIRVVFNKDSYFEEKKDLEMLRQRIEIFDMAEPHIGRAFTSEYVMRKILRMGDDQIKTHKKELEQDAKDPLIPPRPDEDDGAGVEEF
ncbi:portal protein [Vibrio phage EniLVp02]